MRYKRYLYKVLYPTLSLATLTVYLNASFHPLYITLSCLSIRYSSWGLINMNKTCEYRWVSQTVDIFRYFQRREIWQLWNVHQRYTALWNLTTKTLHRLRYTSMCIARHCMSGDAWTHLHQTHGYLGSSSNQILCSLTPYKVSDLNHAQG